MGNTSTPVGNALAGSTPTNTACAADAFAKWLSDPLVSRAADRSHYDENGDTLLLLETLQGIMQEVETALPGVDIADLRAALNAAPEQVDLNAMFTQLTSNGRTYAEACILCAAIDASFVPPAQDHHERRQGSSARRAEIIMRLKAGMTCAQTARECGVSHSRVTQIKTEEGLRTTRRGIGLDVERSRAIEASHKELGSMQATARRFSCAVSTVRHALAQCQRLDAGLAY